ncbi:MAG: hypothetical protein HY508_15420 [Acidobacteria bacterium]|nr:hypothetical protein [Acidobacteriota bacterium]
MKTTLNLALPSSSRERYALAWSIPVGAVGLIALVLLSVSAVKDYQSLRRERASVADLQREEGRVRAQETAIRQELDRPQLREIYRYSRLINDVIGRRELSMLQLVAKVTQVLPEDVRLDGLELDLESGDRVVRLTISAEMEESLEKFLVNLENSSDFTDVNVISHGLPDEKGEGGSDLATAACLVRYVGGGPKPQ